MTARVTVLRGDGIGPEVVEAALGVLGACLPVRVREARIGGDAIERDGDPLPPETLAACQDADAVLLGAVGGPRWENGPLRAEDGLLRLRRGLGLYANLRPARYLGLPTPLREGLARGADVMVVRDLAGGVYFGEPRSITPTEAVNTWRQTTAQVERVARVAFEAARRRRKRVTSVDKANVLEASRLWRGVVTGLAHEYPDVELEHRYVDAMAFEVLQSPRRFDVVLADNLFGDILSDELAAVTGSIGVLASASLGEGTPLFEPVHGSAPALTGLGIANPTGAILSVALMLRYALGRPEQATAVENAVDAALRESRTPDVGGHSSTREFAGAVLRRLHRPSTPEEDGVSAYGWGV
jgi:3-isopropylmalate dehydrogenase